MRIIRAFLYKIGLRPKRGSIFYSPSHALHLAAEEGLKDIEKVWTKTLQHQYLSKLPPKTPNCPTCNGWVLSEGTNQWVRVRETVGMICPTCGHDYGKAT